MTLPVGVFRGVGHLNSFAFKLVGIERERYLLAFICLLAFGLRALFAMLNQVLPYSDMVEYDTIAASVFRGQGFPWETIRPPVYPLFLAAIYAVVGKSYAAVGIVQALVGAATAVATYFLGKQIYDRNVGMVAALMVSLFPDAILYSAMLLAETLFTFLLVALLLTLVYGAKRWRLDLVVGGGLLGIAALTKTVIVGFPLAVLVWLLISKKGSKTALLFFLGIGFAMVVVISPWAVRNYTVFGEFVPLYTHGNVNFWIGNNPQATGRYYWPKEDNPLLGIDDPLEFDRVARDETLKFVVQSPGDFLRLLIRKSYMFWEYRPDPFSVRYLGELIGSWHVAIAALASAQLVMMPLAVVGLASRSGRREGVLLLLLTAVYVFGMTVAAHMGARYRFPLIPLLAVFAAEGLLSLSRTWSGGVSRNGVLGERARVYGVALGGLALVWTLNTAELVCDWARLALVIEGLP